MLQCVLCQVRIRMRRGQLSVGLRWVDRGGMIDWPWFGEDRGTLSSREMGFMGLSLGWC